MKYGQQLYVKITFLCCIYYIYQCYKDSKKCYNDLSQLLEQLLYVKMAFLCCIYYIDQCYKDSKKCYNDLFSVVVRTVAFAISTTLLNHEHVVIDLTIIGVLNEMHHYSIKKMLF